VDDPRRSHPSARPGRRGHRRRLPARRAGGFLLERRTYEIFAAHWPNASEEEQVLAEPLNAKPKYVASRTLAEPLAWQNSTVLQDDVGGAVAALKQEDGQDLHVIGSSELVQTLVAHDLVDEFRVIRPSGAQSESPARVIAAG
jgi:dihydrofolate reductase